MRTLIFGTCYIGPGGAQPYGQRMVELWARLAIKLNPESDVLLVDSASTPDPGEFLGPLGFSRVVLEPDGSGFPDMGKKGGRVVLTFRENLGHLNINGKDGWGRAFCKGIETAIKNDYDFTVCIGADMIFVQPAHSIIEKMLRSGVQVACAWDTTYSFPETDVLFFTPAYMRRCKFIDQYNWPSRTAGALEKFMVPERICELIWKDDLFILPLRGLRDDFNRVTVNNVATAFPYGLDFLTHCRDFAVYERFLEMKGIKV